MPIELTGHYRLIYEYLQRHVFILNACVLCVYLIIYQVSLLFALPPSYISPIWLPAGFVLVCALIFGKKFLPGVFIGSVVSHFHHLIVLDLDALWFNTLTSSLVNGAGTVLTALSAAFLVKKYTSTVTPFYTSQHMALFIFLAGALSCIISASLGVVGLVINHAVGIEDIFKTWLEWWSGDVLGVILFAPIMLVILFQSHHLIAIKQYGVELPLFVYCLLVVLAWSLGIVNLTSLDLGYTPVILLIPLLLWPIFRFKQLVTFLSVFITALLIVTATLKGYGPFSKDVLSDGLLELQIFFIVTSTTTFILSATMTEKHNSLTQLAKAKDEAENASAAKSLFLSQISHELRTPLNAMLGYSQLMLFDPKNKLSLLHHDWVQQIKDNGEHLVTLINDILDLSNIERSQLAINITAINVQVLIDECISTMQAESDEKMVKLFAETGNSHLHVQADPTRLKQVILNLLSNAIKYNIPNGEVKVWFEENQQTVQIFIEDTGLGIDKDKQRDVFNLFDRAGREASNIAGTGIGLAINKRLVDAMKGEIDFVSELGLGSCFWVKMPVITVDAQPEKPQSETLSHQQGNVRKRFLYVEDNRSNQVLLKNVISTLYPDAELILADSAEDGFVVLTELRPDIIFMDIQLPGMSGIDAMLKIKSDPRLNNIPVIALSADATQDNITLGENAGFNHYLTKPIILKDVAEILSELIT